MIKGLSKNIVNFLLSSFFENIEEKQLQTSLIRGKVHLQNVKINKKFFDILYLPYTIKYGYIRSLDLQIPLLYLFQKATITIKDVIIVVKEKNFNDFNIVEEINGIKIAKKNNLKIEENNSSGSNLNQKINKGINSLLYELYNNISIDIENVEIILEGSEKKNYILGFFIKRITSFKNQNHSFKIYKDFSFTDIIIYMDDEKSKYLINKIIKKEEKRKKNNKKNKNVDEIYNKIKDITNNLHKKKYIISEIPIIVLSTILSLENSSQYMHHNSKYIFKKKNNFDLVCSHCDKYLYQCKEIKKEKGIFEKILNKNINFNDDNNNKLNNEECAICINEKKIDLEKSKHDESVKELMNSNTNNNIPIKKDENQIDNNKNNNICESCKKKMSNYKNLYGNETSLYFNSKENKLSNIEKFNILEENINFKENEYITFIVHIENFNVNLSFNQLCYIFDIVNFYLIYSCFVNGLYLEEWLNIPEVKEILMYKKELLKKRKKEKYDKDFIENFEYTHSFHIIYSLRKHVNNILKESNNSINNKTTITPQNDDNNMKNDTFSSKNSASNLDVSNELDSNDKIKKNENEQEKNTIIQKEKNDENLHNVRNMQSKSSEKMPVVLNFKLLLKKANLNLYSHEKTNKIIQTNMSNFELILKNYINNDFAYFILLNDINILFLYKNKKYPLLSLFKTNSIEAVNRKVKKRESFNKKGRRKSINYLFNPYVCNSISQGVINRNDTITNVSNSSNERGLNKDGGGSTSIIDSKSEKSIYNKNNMKNRQDKNKEIEKNKFNDNKINNKSKDDNKMNSNEIKNSNKENEHAISFFIYNKFDTSQNKIYFRCNRNILITLSVKEIYNIMNINYDFKCLDFEKKIKTYQSLYYYYLLGKKYCRELYISSEKDFADINIQFMNNIYINLIINKKYSLLARIQNISLNSFFFTKTNIQAYLEKLTMINDNNTNNNKLENENQENASGLDASNSIITGSTPNNNILSGSNDSIINGSNSETSYINNRNKLTNNINDDKKSITKVINENESKLLLNNSYSNIYYNDSKRENTSVSNSYYHKMLSSYNDICDDNQKIKMKYKKYYQDFLRVNDLKNIEKSKIFEHKYNRNKNKNPELNNIGSSNEIKNTYITTSNNIEKNKYECLSSSSYKSKIYSINYNDNNYIPNSSSHINGYIYDYDSEEINEKKKKNRCKKTKRKVYINSESESTNSYNYQKKKKIYVVNKDGNNINSDDNTNVTCSEKEETETMITAVQQKRSCFNLSIFFMKNKSNEKIQKVLLEENSKNKKYILKPLKISLDTIIYNFKDGNEKRMTFIHTNYKQYLYFNFDDKHIFKLIFFYYHYKFYVDKIYEQLYNRNNSDYLNLNTIDFRSYKTLQILLDNALINNKSEIENKYVHKKTSNKESSIENGENNITEVIDSNIIDKEIETNECSKVCGNKNEEANNINKIYISTIENPDNIQENSNNNTELNINDSDVENTDIIDIEKYDENNTTVCINTENDISVKKDSIKIQKTQKNIKKKEKKKKNNYGKSYNSKNDRNMNNEISNSNKHEFITFLSKIKIYFNNYKKNKRMVSIHIYDVLIYMFNDDHISKFVLNLKKFNVLNCLSYIDNSNINRNDASICENNFDIQNEHNFNTNRCFNNEKYYSINSITGFENKYQHNKTNKIDSKLYDKKNSSYNGIYLYNSILKLAKNGDFIFSYDCKNPKIDKFNKRLTNIDTYSANYKNVISDNEIENEEHNKKMNGYQELYNSTSINISGNPKKIHFDNINKRFNKKSIDFIHTNYYNTLNVDYFTFNGYEKKKVNSDDTLEICPSSIDVGISSVEIGIIPVDTPNISIEPINNSINIPNISTEISNSIIEKSSQTIENGKINIDNLTNSVKNVNTNNDINVKNERCSNESVEDINLVENSNEVSYFTDETDKFLSIQNTKNSSELTGEVNERSDEILNHQNGGENKEIDASKNKEKDIQKECKKEYESQKKENSMLLEKKRKSELDVSTVRNLKKGKYLDNNKGDFNKYSSLEIKENDKIDQVEKNRDNAPEDIENGAENNRINLEMRVLSIDESISLHAYSNEIELKNGESLEYEYRDEEYEEIEIIKHKENDDIKNIAFHLVNFEVIIDYTYFINLYKWFTKLNLKYEKIKKISDFAAYSHNSINEKSDTNTPKYNYTLFLQNNKIYIPIYKLSIYEYTYYENAKNNLYTSFLPIMQFHFSCSYKSINENDENLKNAQVRNFGSKLVMPSIQMYKHKKSRRWKICILNFNCKDKNSETILNDFRFQLNAKRKENIESLEIDEDSSNYGDINMDTNNCQKMNSLNTYLSAMSSNIFDEEKDSNIKNSIKRIVRFYNDPIIIKFSIEIIKNLIICYNNFNYFINCINKIQNNINNCSKDEKYCQNNYNNLKEHCENSNVIKDILNYLYNEANDILFEYFLDDFHLSLYEGNSNLNMALININMFDIKIFFQKKHNIRGFINFHLNIDAYDNYKILYDNLIEKFEILLSFENSKNKMNMLNFNIETSYINILYTNKIKDLIINYTTLLLEKYKTYIEAGYDDIDAEIRRKEQQMNSKLLNFYNNFFIIKNQNNPKSVIEFKDILYDNNIISKIYNFTGLTINLRFKQSLRSKVQNRNEKKNGNDNTKNYGNKNKFIFYELPNNGHGGLLKDENGKVCELAIIIKLFNYIYEIVDIERNKNACDIRFLPIIYDLKKNDEKEKIIIKKYDNNYDMYNEYSVKNKVFKTFIKLYIQTNIDDKGVVTIYFSSNLFIHNITNTNFVILYHPIIYYFLLFNEIFIYNSNNNLNKKKHSLKGAKTVLKSNEKYYFPIISFIPLLVIYDYMKKKNDFIEKVDADFINTNLIKTNYSKKYNGTYSDINATLSKYNKNHYIDCEHGLFKQNEIDNDGYTNSFICYEKGYDNLKNNKKNSLNNSETYNSCLFVDNFSGEHVHNIIPINSNYNFLNTEIFYQNKKKNSLLKNTQVLEIEDKINLHQIKESCKYKLNKILKKLKIYINDKNINNSIKNINNIYIVKKDVYNYYINKYYSNSKCYLDIFNFLKKNGAKKLFSNSSIREIIYRHSYDFQKYNLFSQTLKLKTIKVICYDPDTKYGNGKYKNESDIFKYKHKSILNNSINNSPIINNENREECVNYNKQIDCYEKKHSSELKQIQDSNYLMKFMTLYEKKNKNQFNSAKNNILLNIDTIKTNERYLGNIHRNRKGSNLHRMIKYYYESSSKDYNDNDNDNDNDKINEQSNGNKNSTVVDNPQSDHIINVESNESSSFVEIQNNIIEEKKEKKISNNKDVLYESGNKQNDNLKKIKFSAKKQSHFSNTLICEQKNLEINKIYTFGILIDYIFEIHNLMFNDISIGYYQKYSVNNIQKKIKKIKKETILSKSIKYLDNIPNYIKFFYQINGNSTSNVENNEINYIFHFFSKKISIHQLNNTNSKYIQIKMHIGCIYDKKNDIIYKKKKFKFNLFRRKTTISNTIPAYYSSCSKKCVYLSPKNYEKLCMNIPRFFFLNIILRKKTDFICTNNVNSFKKIIDSNVLQLLLYSYFYFQNNLDNDIIIQSNSNFQKVKNNSCMLFGELETTKVVLKILHNNKLFVSKKLKINEVCLNKKIILACKNNKKKEYLFLSLNITIYGNIYNTKIITINNRYTIINNTNHTLYVHEICKEFKIIKKDNKTLSKIEKNNAKEIKQTKIDTDITEKSNISITNKIFNVFEIKPHESYYYHPLHANKYYLKFSYTNINDYINNKYNILSKNESYEFMDKYTDTTNLAYYLKKKIAKKTKNPTYLVNIDKNDKTIKKKEESFNQFYTSLIDIEKIGNAKIFHKALIKVCNSYEISEINETENVDTKQFDLYNRTKLVDEIPYSENIKTQNETILLVDEENETKDVALSVKNSIESVKNFIINMNDELVQNTNESVMKYMENMEKKTKYYYKEENIISEVNITLNSNTSIEINISIDNNPDTIIHNNTNYCLVYYQKKTKKKIINLLKPHNKDIFGWTDLSKPKVVKFFLILKKAGVYVFYCNVDIVKEHNCIFLNNNRKINVFTKIENGKRVFCLEEINTKETKQLNYFSNNKSFIKLNEEKKLNTSNKKKNKKIVKINFYRKFKLKKNRDDDIRTKQKFVRYRKLKKKKKNFLKEFNIINKNPFNAIYMKAKKKKQKIKQTERKMKNTKIMSNTSIIEYDTNKNGNSIQTKKFDEKKFKALFMKKTIKGKKKKKKNINKFLYDNYSDKKKNSHQTFANLIYTDALEDSKKYNSINNKDIENNDKVSEQVEGYEPNSYYVINKNVEIKRKLSDYIFKKLKNNEKKLKGLKKIYPSFLRNSKSIEFNEIMQKCFSDKEENVINNEQNINENIFTSNYNEKNELNKYENIHNSNIKSQNKNATYSRTHYDNNNVGNVLKKKNNFQINFFTNIQLLFKGIRVNLLQESSNYLISFELNNLFVKKEYIENIGYYNVDVKIKNIISYAIYKYLNIYALLYTNDEINLKKNNIRIFMNKLEKKRNLFLKKNKYRKNEAKDSITSSLDSIINLKDKDSIFHDYRFDNTNNFNDNSGFIICNFQYIKKFETLFFKYFLLSIKPVVINADINSITVLFYFYKTFYNDKNFENDGKNINKIQKDEIEESTMYTYTLNDDKNDVNIGKKKNNENRDNYYSSNLINGNDGKKDGINNMHLTCREVKNCLILDDDNKKKNDLNNEKGKDKLIKDKIYRNSNTYIKNEESGKNNNVTSYTCEKGKANKHVYLQYVYIDKINILLNFKSEYKKEFNNSNINDIFYEEYISAYNKLGDISNCNIILKSLSNIHIFTSSNNLFNFLLNFYYNQTIVNLSNLLISFNIIGSPTSFIAHVKKSFIEFFTILKDSYSIDDKEYEIDQNEIKTKTRTSNLTQRNTLSYKIHGEIGNISFPDYNYGNNSGNINLFSKIQNNENIFNIFDKSNESSLIDENEDIMVNEKYIMHLLNDYNQSCENNTIYEDTHLNSIKNSISLEIEQENETKKMIYSDYDDDSIESAVNDIRKNEWNKKELENLIMESDSISLSYLNFEKKKKNIYILDNKVPASQMKKKSKEKKETETKKKENVFIIFISFIIGFWKQIIYLIRKMRRLCLGIYVLIIKLILSLLFSVTLILQSLINIIDKINTNNSNKIFLRNKKYEKNKPLVFSNIEEYHNFNLTKLFYYYISLYINIFRLIYHNILYKIKKNKKDILRETNMIKASLKLNTKKKRKFAFLFNFFLIIFTIFKIFMLGHIVFSLLCLLAVNNILQTILRSCIKLVYYQSSKNCFDFLNTNNINHICTISYIKINQILNKYIPLNEPFKFFLTYQDFIDIKTQNKINYFVYTKELFFYIQENNVLFLFRKNDLKKIDVIIHTVTNSFTINRFYNRKESVLFRKNISRNVPDIVGNTICEENNSVTSSFYNKSLTSNDLKENKNIIYFLNSELALTKKNEIINLNNNDQNYIITINITVRNNMNIMESVYYNPNKFFKSLFKIEKNYNNIYSPLFKSPSNDGKNNKEKYNKNKTNIENRYTGSKSHGFITFIIFLLKCTIVFYPIYLLFKRNKTNQNEALKYKSKSNEEEYKGINDELKKGKKKNFKKNVPKYIVFKLNFEDFQSCLNIFECLCRFVNND
ncbi:conserved Plasmodium protein, unknown function [Plasmodium berghei]|uniref:Uncharacterized protein n=2 Tax=Plasmodium berghei TaxID=5821 RepID=A0A509AGC7_PLABA|nr:conserved Plasmodium protein, unknown function [Plasmodium berghei ANKA]SCL92690.1 conserved Plasmodium protein, unknown function [Plasmodium berghei]SCM15695.1 conserved Plasmodium protein, unknown function [Plasmodium berghei]SCN22875.1 conserved Plasmodium protein, unknown function [Plasmodium berghei]VUC54471.1 conserved Plasmodium protein, unknown function [Plasmodium berghei ANKA]|eukprot:XP_034420300.1 conserved Plasmodium protein, unknown function [Plasmodium berghei ANKA]